MRSVVRGTYLSRPLDEKYGGAAVDMHSNSSTSQVGSTQEMDDVIPYVYAVGMIDIGATARVYE